MAADPRLSKAPCANALIVLMSFVTIDKRTLKPTPAYASVITLMVRGGMKETSARLARKLLLQEKYLVPTGAKTKDGCVKYRLENPAVERIAMHVVEATEYLKEQLAERRAKQRRKAGKQAVGAQCEPTDRMCGFANKPCGCAIRTQLP